MVVVRRRRAGVVMLAGRGGGGRMGALTVLQRRAHMGLFWKGSRVYKTIKLDDLMSERPIDPFLHLIEVLYGCVWI